MKPDWQHAPEWANFLAQDADGRWYWYEAAPIPCKDGLWRCKNGTKHDEAITMGHVEARP